MWRVEFGAALPAGVGRTALVQVDTISNAGTVIRNSLLTDTNCNLGRLKSSHALLSGNTFRHAAIPNLEIAWLPQFFEGPVVLTNITLRDNTIEGEGPTPIHCGPYCGSETCLYDEDDAPTGTWSQKAQKGCAECPDCFSGDTPSRCSTTPS